MRDTHLALKVVVVASSLVSVLVHGKRLAVKRGNPRIFRVTVVGVLISSVLVVGIVSYRLHHLPTRPRPSTASALPVPSSAP